MTRVMSEEKRNSGCALLGVCVEDLASVWFSTCSLFGKMFCEVIFKAKRP